ncbi:flavodoxin domain-containing protein [Yoonia sp.]|jgi:menaquinone-dependent protoporphyrinogen oxidase|uniref:flavodoxin domain-containing protein n=1 Tax=Yoonia sp. TaxID=2212373 RepID=UPI0025DE8023|nr:flavodoxin domain-containing protein [Yoonia sp.]
MKILIAYASTEGQTRKIVRFCADYLTTEGHSVELLPAEDAIDTDLSQFDAALLAGSVHGGKYQKPLIALASRQADALAHMGAAFMSVSLAAAGDDEDDWEGLEDCVNRFVSQTEWSPARVMHVAGAFRFSEYDFLKSWAMRWIAAQKGQDVDPHKDKEYTDWAALRIALSDWISAASSR